VLRRGRRCRRRHGDGPAPAHIVAVPHPVQRRRLQYRHCAVLRRGRRRHSDGSPPHIVAAPHSVERRRLQYRRTATHTRRRDLLIRRRRPQSVP